MSLPKACIFDLDGVIVDTVPAHYTAWKAIADELNIPFSEEDNEQLKGVSRTDSMKKILAMSGLSRPDDEILEMTKRKNNMYVDIISRMTTDDILPGVLDLIRLLKASRIAVAVGSSSKNTPAILKAIGLDKTFDAVVDGNQVSRSKPDPEIFLKGSARLGVAPENCVVFEDAASGIAAAKAGRMKCIGVGDPEVLGAADKVISDLTQIDLDFLRNL